MRKGKKLQTVKYQEHRDVSLLYGAMKDFEDSSRETGHHLDSNITAVNPSIKTSRNSTKLFNHRQQFSKEFSVHSDERNVSGRGMITHTNAIQNQDSDETDPNVKVRHVKPAAIKRHKISSRSARHRHTRTRKRTRVDEALNKERQNIAKTIDSLDDLPGAYSKGIDMDGMDINEVNMIDNNTLSDYFHALNDNASDSNNNNNNNNGNDVYAPTTSSSSPKLTWDENSPSDTEESSSSSNDDFYDAIDNGDSPPPIKMKKVRPTKSQFNKFKSKPSKGAKSVSQNPGSVSQSANFRVPSQEDFENFFRGMLDHFGNGRRPGQPVVQGKNYPENNQESHENQNNVTAFLDSHDGLRHGNVKKLVSLGSPERVEVTKQMKQHNMDPTDDTNPSFVEDETTERDDGEKEGMASFLPPANPISWMENGPFGNNRISPNKPSPSQEMPPDNFKNPPLTSHMPMHLHRPMKNANPNGAELQYAVLPMIPFKGTRIMGGKISGGQISGGVIQGGQIKAGLIEGGVIKGGQVVGGHITNGTMEGGVVANTGQMRGGHLVDGRIEGGQLLGGNVFGGKILGGTVEGGNIKGGVVAGGRFRGGSMQGGVLKGGEIQSGIMKGGKVEGGILHGGNIEGGEFKFGDISGGTLKAGAMLGGELKNGSIEGGTLKGGTIEGGVLKGGVMEGGYLKGGLVLAGKIKGGVIEGGVIEGGEIGDGVVITGGKINATIIGTGSSIDKTQRLGGLFKQGVNSQHLGLKVDQQKYQHGSNKAVHGSKVMSDALPIQQASTHITQINHGLKQMHPNINLKIPLREGTLKMLPQEHDLSDDDSLEKLLLEGKSGKNGNTPEPELSSERFFEEQDQPSRAVEKKGGKHHLVVDGVSFDLPNEGFADLIDKMKNEDLVNYYRQPETKGHLQIKHISNQTKSITSLEGKNEHIKPEDLEMKLSFPTKARSSVTRWDKEKSLHGDMEEASMTKSSRVNLGKLKAVSLNPKDIERRKYSYLKNNIIRIIRDIISIINKIKEQLIVK